MEQETSTELFSLQIDPLTKLHLTEIARWGKFLSIVGFILCGLIILSGVFFGAFFNFLTGGTTTNQNDLPNAGISMVAGAFVYIIIATIYFFPCLFLYRFSSAMKTALNSNDQEYLSQSFQNLKSLFKYVGIITIIVIAVYALMLAIFVLRLAARS